MSKVDGCTNNEVIFYYNRVNVIRGRTCSMVYETYVGYKHIHTER